MLQRMLDAYLMESAQLKINLFDEFWKYIVDRDHATDHDKKKVADKVHMNVDRLGTSNPTILGSQILDKRQRIKDLIERRTIDCEPGFMPPFIMQQDPMVLFAGIPSARDEKSSGKSVIVRLDGQEISGLEILAGIQNSRTGFRRLTASATMEGSRTKYLRI